MSWIAVGTVAVGAISKGMGSSSARRAQQGQDRMRDLSAMGQLGAQQTYYNSMQDELARANAENPFQYRPATVNNGYATSNVDPNTGAVSYSLNGPYQGLRDQYLGGAGTMLRKINGMNPDDFAKDRYTAALGLRSASDENANQSLLQRLYNGGGYGLSVNMPAAGGGVVGANPLVNSFMNARNQANNELAYGSLREGQDYRTSLLNGANSMFNMGAGIDRMGSGVLTDANTWGNTFNTARANQFMNMSKMRLGTAGQLADATSGYYRTLGGYDGGSGANTRASMWNSIGNNADQYGNIVGRYINRKTGAQPGPYVDVAPTYDPSGAGGNGLGFGGGVGGM